MDTSNLTVGTAGHVDHGKSALVEALTGTHPDRLVEEQDRGMTIDLGFSFMTLDDGRDVPVIDVPGHERFLKTMVAGVSGIHLVLFVVAADEGVMPQTVEHLGAVSLMGVERGLIVLTKCDLADEEWTMLVEDDVRELVAGTFLEKAPVHHVSSTTGAGIELLKKGIEAELNQVKPRPTNGIFRMPIDRAFTMKGFGTIVAGTVLSGQVRQEDALELLPSRTAVRLRGMQTHGHEVEHAEEGQRAALNLSNVKVTEVRRGDELSVPGYLLPTMMLDARIQVMSSLEEPLVNRTRVRLHKGTAEVIGRLVLLDQEKLEPGSEGFVQFRLESPVVAERNERFVIRGFSSMRLLGGGVFLDVYPGKHGRFRKAVLQHLRAVSEAGPAALVEQIMKDAYGEQRVRSVDDIKKVTNQTGDTVAKHVDDFVADGTLIRFSNGSVIHKLWYDRILDEILMALGELHREQRLKETVPRDSIRSRLSSPIADVVYDVILKDLLASAKIEQIGSGIRLPSHQIRLTPAEEGVRSAMEGLCRGRELAVLSANDVLHADPDARSETAKAMAGYLFDTGVLVEFMDRNIMHRDSLREAREKLVSYLGSHGTVRAKEFREYMGISRAHATALLDYFCDQGVTRRDEGTHRLAEPEQ